MGAYKTIAVDFDGVIAQYDGWKGVGVFGEPIPGVAGALRRIRESGRKVIIYTTRGETEDLERYLEQHHIPYDYINHNPQNFTHMNQGKPIADVYVDDRAVCFQGEWSEEFVATVLDYQPWHRCEESGVQENCGGCDTVEKILDRAKETYKIRQAVYQNSYIVHGSVMAELFPTGVNLRGGKDFARYALVDMVVGKLIRYTRNFPAMHKDSLHDMMVYTSMLQEVDGMGVDTWNGGCGKGGGCGRK